ncbi:uncharacterized protein LOC105640471 [Jatropha curcas]|uniref:uncharacterized protein LOC105640471 n=1 Tax=Jatropha curcas TaxID=180498 RepID=UPI0005FB9DC5|nr:uncharacterized protein LOC105640471 [Jatropha curcas]
MEWSPQNAMKAYLDTLQLCKTGSNNENNPSNGSETLIEPKCMEFISALAAGKKAKLMVEITTEGVTPLTMALAVAAKHTGGKLICFLIHHQDFKKCKNHIQNNHQDLENVIEFVFGNIFQVVMHYKNIDFLVMDGRLEDNFKLIEKINLNPSGSIIVRHNLHYRKCGVPLGNVLNGRKGVKCVTLPIGDGVELTRIESKNKISRRHKRFHVTFDN